MRDIPTEAVHFVKRLRGTSQAVLTRCSDGRFYAVKFTNNPNGLLALLNEVVTTRLAQLLYLPVPDYSLVNVSEWLVTHSPELFLSNEDDKRTYQCGIHFGSMTPYASSQNKQIFEFLPAGFAHSIEQEQLFAGMLALDVWTGRSAPRQVLFVQGRYQRHYDPIFIDHRENFSTPDIASVLPLAKCDDGYYDGVTGWDSFEPWLTRIEAMDEATISSSIGNFPEEWLIDPKWKGQITTQLLRRCKCIRSAISTVLAIDPRLFPNWGKPKLPPLQAGPIKPPSLSETNNHA